jgi:flagellar hook assembly protein FlgD
MSVRLRVFDVAGRVVATLAEGPLAAGEHPFRWNGRDDRAAPAPAGLYFVRLDAPGIHERQKLVRVR